MKNRYFLFLLVGIGWQLNCIAQYDSTYRPEIYQSRVEMFKAMPAGKKDIIFYGNSITFWGDWATLLGKPIYKNRSIPGDTSFGLLELLDKTLHGRPRQIFIMIGINDLARGVPREVILNNYKRILAIIRDRSPRTSVYFQSVLPVNESFGKLNNHYKRADEIPEINNFLQQWTKEEHVGYVDLFSAMVNENGRLKKEFTWDGIHLTINGYWQWINVLRRERLIK